MKQKDKPSKKVIIRYKGKNNNNSERIKTESQQDINKNLSSESRVKNTLQNSSNNFERYTDVATEENRRTLVPKKMNRNQVEDTTLRKTLFVKNKEKGKLPGSKTKNQKKEKNKISPKGKKLVNFSQKEIGIKPQKSERNLKKAKKEEAERELKLNKSVGNLKNDIFNKKDNSYSSNKSINSEKDTINIDIIENKYEKDNRNMKQVDNNEKIRQPSLKNYKKEEDIENEKLQNEETIVKNIQKQDDENQIQIIELKSDMLELKREEFKKENEDRNNINENKKDNNNQNDINNKNSKNEEIYNSQSNKKVVFNNENKLPEKQTNKKGNKAYLNFVQNIKKANKKKKDNKITNILKYEDPKSKLTNIIKKVNFINKAIMPAYKGINKNKDLRQTINNPLISNLREDILNSKKEAYGEQINSCKNILKDNKNNNNINSEKYSGLILLKFNEGEKIKEIKLEGQIEQINNILSKEKIGINNKEIILIDKNEFERIQKENEKIQDEILKLKEENDKQRELLNYYENEKKSKEEPASTAKRKKTIEEENNQFEEDNLKIKEIQNRINKYKEELKKGANIIDNGKNERMSCRIKYNKKENFVVEQKMKELEKKKDNLKEENAKEYKEINNINNKKNLEIKQEQEQNKIEIKKEINKNNNINKNINIEKKENNIITNKDNKEKDKSKGYSKALDRFKKRFKKGNSVEVRTKKSEKINEIARQLENVMGKNQSSEIIDYNNSTEIIHEQNPIESLENQPVITNKAKKPQKPQI